MITRDLFFWGVLTAGLAFLAPGALRPSTTIPPARTREADADQGVASIVGEVDRTFRRRWTECGLVPAPPATDLALFRRLSLALVGTIPSLEEIRRFEAIPAPERIDTCLDNLLRDRRFADHLAERLSRAFVGTEDGPFLLFRRRRFANWLSDAITRNRPYDEIVRDLIADVGLWTDHPATNFITATFDQEAGLPDPERLAARVSRAFLGIRLDCARCHDHPFQTWKQDDFRGLAAYFGGVYSGLRGIRDGRNAYRPADRRTKEPTEVEPRVPFGVEPPATVGSPRARLAAWIVDPGNEHFARVTVNRIWSMMMGRPLVEPIDDIPVGAQLHPALGLLAADSTAHRYDLQRLIRVIGSTEVFRLDSTHGEAAESSGSWEEREKAWASFPLTMLRPAQMGEAVIQSGSLTTIDARSPWPVRLGAFTATNDFVRRYGDASDEDEPLHCGTISQRLLMMNGDLVREKSKEGLFTASSRIAALAPDDRRAVEVAYLTVLTRRPTEDELSHFLMRLAGSVGDARKDRLTDLFWTLLNSTEFSWNH